MTEKNFRYFTIFGVMRTGSNLLERNLNQFDGLRCYGELFNPAFLGKPGQDSFLGITRTAREARPGQLIDRIMDDAAPELPGFRLFNGHDPRILRRAITDPHCGKILLRRTPLDSYVSLKIARETDQWMLANPKKRRDAMIRFEPEEYRSYVRETEGFYAQLRKLMQAAGETAFEIDYSELKDLSVMNGVAAFLGCDDRLTQLEEKITRQNPGSLIDKVSNHAEMLAALREGGGLHLSDRRERAERGGLRMLQACRTRPLIFAAIPGGPTEPVARWMHGLDGSDPEPPNFAELLEQGEVLDTFANRRELSAWRAAKPDHIAFTVVRHPLLRAYRVFEERILPSGDAGFPMIRDHLENYFGLRVPLSDAFAQADAPEALRLGHGPDQHRAAFHIFLDFLKANLTGQTSARTDGRWALQSEFVAGFNTIVPLSLVVQESKLLKAAAYLRNMVGPKQARNAPLRNTHPTHMIDLETIVTPETEERARAAYSEDYEVFGFGSFTDELKALKG